MATLLNPYLSFQNKARAAMEFYKSVFGGELTMQTYKEGHLSEKPAEADKIMHAQLTTSRGMTIMGADVSSSTSYTPGENSFSISISGDDETELRGYYDKLAEGGKVTMPLEKAPWGDIFGMVTDKFGISWLVNINAKKS